MKKLILVASTLLMTSQLFAQSKNDIISSEGETITKSSKPKYSISLGADGIRFNDKQRKARRRNNNNAISYSIGWDLGLNSINDKTGYNDYAILNVSPMYVITKNDMAIKNSKSWNVNLWPVLASIHLYKKSVNINTGLGMQIYNFRYINNIDYKTNVNTFYVVPSNNVYSKNKLALNYLSVPLTLQCKPKIGNQHLVIGAGVVGGYLLKAWTKQITNGNKTKDNVSTLFNDFNISATAEIGIEDKFRIYGTYGLTQMHKTVLDQQPIAFGFRFGGL